MDERRDSASTSFSDAFSSQYESYLLGEDYVVKRMTEITKGERQTAMLSRLFDKMVFDPATLEHALLMAKTSNDIEAHFKSTIKDAAMHFLTEDMTSLNERAIVAINQIDISDTSSNSADGSDVTDSPDDLSTTYDLLVDGFKSSGGEEDAKQAVANKFVQAIAVFYTQILTEQNKKENELNKGQELADFSRVIQPMNNYAQHIDTTSYFTDSPQFSADELLQQLNNKVESTQQRIKTCSGYRDHLERNISIDDNARKLGVMNEALKELHKMRDKLDEAVIKTEMGISDARAVHSLVSTPFSTTVETVMTTIKNNKLLKLDTQQADIEALQHYLKKYNSPNLKTLAPVIELTINEIMLLKKGIVSETNFQVEPSPQSLKLISLAKDLKDFYQVSEKMKSCEPEQRGRLQKEGDKLKGKMEKEVVDLVKACKKDNASLQDRYKETIANLRTPQMKRERSISEIPPEIERESSNDRRHGRTF